MLETKDLELRLDASGKILEILSLHPPFGSMELQTSLLRYLDESSIRPFLNALSLCASQGYALEEKVVFRTENGEEAVAAFLLREPEGVRFVNLHESGKTLRVLEDLIRLNGELVNEIRQNHQSRRAQADYETSLQEIMKLNSELVNAQRDLMKQNRELEHLNQMLESLSFMDELTQIGNRRRFFRDLQVFLGKERYVLVMMDINRFKNVNDTRGHEFGDIVLRSLAEELDSLAIRYGGNAYRLGGDEFSLLIPAASDLSFSEHRLRIDERLRDLHPDISIAFGEDVLGEDDLRDGRVEKRISEIDARMYSDKKGLR